MTATGPVAHGAERSWRLAAIALAVALLPLMLLVSRDFGVTWDEMHRQANGERIWLLYQGIVREPDTPAEHLYGGLFDVVAVALQPRLPFDVFDTRHFVNAFFGWIGVVACGLVAGRAAGWRAAFLAMVALAVWPSYFGHSMNNPKDAPFAALAILALSVMAWTPTKFPYLDWPRIVALAIVLGLTLGVRPGGLLFLAYAALWIVATLWASHETNPRRLAATATALATIALLAGFVPIPVWPYLWERPFVGILEAVEGVSRYEWFGTVLFNGRDVPSNDLPWNYVPAWLLLKTPPVLLAGTAASLSLLATAGLRRRVAVGLWFAALFPIGYVIARNSTLYDGLRHLLFILPPLAALSALGWDEMLRRAHGRARTLVIAVGLIGLAEPVVFQLRNHPNQTVYFSPLNGGPSAAYARYELDYWGNCLFQALRDTAEIARATNAPVIISGRQDRQLLLNARRIPQVAVVDPHRGLHELEINLMRGRAANLRAFAARTDVLWWITTADGAHLCAVQRGPRFNRLEQRLRASNAMHLIADPGT